ncbi:unnamed protein product [Sphagnum compactum]
MEKQKKDIEVLSESWRKKSMEMQAQMDESAQKLLTAEMSLLQHEKDMEAVNVRHQRELEAAATREEQLHQKETELRAQIDHQETKIETLLKSLKEIQSEKDGGANVAEWDAQGLKDQLEDLKSHHTTTLRQLASSSTRFQSFTMKQLIEFVRQLHGLPVDWKRENAD